MRKRLFTMVTVVVMVLVSLTFTACQDATYEDVIDKVFEEIRELEAASSSSSSIAEESETTDSQTNSGLITLPSEEETTTQIVQKEETTTSYEDVTDEITQEYATWPSINTENVVPDEESTNTTNDEVTTEAQKEQSSEEATTTKQPEVEESTTVAEPSIEEIRVTGVSMSRTNITLKEGESEYITITVSPSTATNKYLMLSSSNTHVATIDAFGKITANGAGTAVITAVTVDGNYETACKVTVTSSKVIPTNISLNKESMQLSKGNSETLIATVYPENATNKSIIWSSSNTKVATVSSTGKVTAVETGTAVITAKSASGDKLATCSVVVISVVNNVSLNKSNITIKEGEIATLVATITPADAANKLVTWSSSNKNVATVDSAGKVTAVGAGTATITVKTKDGGKTAVCKVTVKTPVTGVSITNKKDVALDWNHSGNKYFQCSISVSPSTASNKNVVWSSSDASVATVSSSGKITAVARGTAIITVKTVDGAYTDSIKVYVYKSNASIPTYGKNLWYRISLGSTANRLIDVYNGRTYNGAKVQLCASNGSDAQLWQFHDYTSSNGGIALVPKCNSGSFIFDVNRGSSYTTPFASGNLIDLWTLGADDSASMWEMVRMWDDGYVFRLVNTNWVAGVTSTSAGTQLVLKKFDPFDMNQRWFLEAVDTSGGSSTSQGIETAIAWAESQKSAGNMSYCYWCLKFVGDAFRQGGIGNAGYSTATLAGNALITSRDTNPPRGTVVFWDWYGTIDGVYANYGHVGISLGNGQVIHADYNGIKITGLSLSGRTYRGWGTWK